MSEHGIQSYLSENYPVVNFRSRQDPKYVPAEACTVEPGYVFLVSHSMIALGLLRKRHADVLGSE